MNDAISRLSQKIKQNKKKTVGILRETWASCDKRALVISIGDDKRVSRGQARHNGENLCRQCYYLIRGRSLFYSPGPASACATCAISGRKRRRILCDECRHSFWNTMERERGRKSLYNTWGVVSFMGGKCIMKICLFRAIKHGPWGHFDLHLIHQRRCKRDDESIRRQPLRCVVIRVYKRRIGREKVV